MFSQFRGLPEDRRSKPQAVRVKSGALKPEPLEFHGRDAKECEKFITAVSRQALAVGKQRDDQWIADFASSYFTHGALRWWDGLDEQTQCSWKLLRKAMFGRYLPLFYGKSGEEAEEFVHMIHERALDVGKQQDNEWIAGFVASSFVGDALQWYVSLDHGVQNDWKRLRQAILTQYPRGGAGIASFITVPTPILAAKAEEEDDDEFPALELVEDDEEVVDETGIDSNDIEMVISQVNCSRAKAVRALRNSGGDVINAIMAASG